MVEKITINPTKIRAYGNIIGAKDSTDYDTYNAYITEITDTVYGSTGNVFSMECEPHISLTATNPYMVSGETTDLVVSLVNGFGSPVSGKTVTISDGTSVYSGITNTNGLFTLYDVEVSADTTFTATYSSVSATCKVEYCLFVDYAVTSNHNTNYTVGNAITKTVGGNYTTLSATNSNSTTGRTYSTSSFSGDLTLEMEANMVNYASNWAFYLGFRNSTNHSIARLLVGDWRYIKFTRKDGVCKGYISTDKNNWSEMSMYSDDVGSSDVQLELYIYNATGTSHSVQFKNVRIKAL